MFLVPDEGASPSQSSNSSTELQETHPALWALEECGTQKASWDQRRRGSSSPCQQPLHCVCRPSGTGGKEETVWFPLLGQLCPHSHQWELKDETSSLLRHGDEAVTGSSGNRCP